jgi:domain of unknown function (DUF477)
MGKKMRKLVTIIIPVIMLFLGTVSYADTLPAKAPMNNIYDPKQVLNDMTTRAIIYTNMDNSDTPLNAQIAVVITDTDKPVNEIATDIYDKWSPDDWKQLNWFEKLYTKKNKYSVVIAASTKTNKIAIKTDDYVKHLGSLKNPENTIDNATKYFKQKEYDKGIDSIVTVYKNGLMEYNDVTKSAIKSAYSGKPSFSESLHDVFSNPFMIILVPLALLFMLTCDDKIKIKSPLKPYIDKLRSTKATKKNQKQRSKYAYTGHDKLYPNDDDFIDNKSWTSLRKAQYQQYLTER